MKLILYAVRHQHRGVVSDTVFAVEPSAAVLDAAKVHHDRLSGREGWVRAQPVVLDTTGLPAEVEAALAAHLALFVPPPPVDARAPGELPPVKITAVATLGG